MDSSATPYVSANKSRGSRASKGGASLESSPSWVTALKARQTLRGSTVESASSEETGNIKGLKHILISPICLLILCLPVGLVGHYCLENATLTFWMMFLSLIPLAKVLGDATEELAVAINNDMISGLLNATFGNAVEMIMTVSFLQKHEYLVVKTTLIGSVLSNMLLVLGMSFFAGGLVKIKARKIRDESTTEPLMTVMEKEQNYSTAGALVNTSMLLLSCLVLCLVTVFRSVTNLNGTDDINHNEYMLPISRVCSIFIILSYVAFIIFQLVTHKEMMGDDEGDEEGAADEDEKEQEEGLLSLNCSVALLLAATVIVSIASEFLTDALEGALAGSGMGKPFMGIILLPIVGNACEHAAAIRFAMQEKAGLSVGIAVGSSVQVALFVAPLSVLMGWMLGDGEGGKNMDLDFGALDVTVLTLSVIVILSIILDGKSTWLEGYMLMTAYAIVAVLYWYLPGSE